MYVLVFLLLQSFIHNHILGDPSGEVDKRTAHVSGDTTA